MKLTARSVWNERAVRTSTCLHCAHEWVCVDVSANRLSTPPSHVSSWSKSSASDCVTVTSLELESELESFPLTCTCR